jgi:hypothetical protein
MLSDLRPVLHALIGWYAEPMGLIGTAKIVTLEEAIEYQQFGAWVLVDPIDEIDLATYEREHRVNLHSTRT